MNRLLGYPAVSEINPQNPATIAGFHFRPPSLLFPVKRFGRADADTLPADVTDERNLEIPVGENRAEGTGIHTDQAVCAFLRIDLDDAVHIADRPFRASLYALSALSAQAYAILTGCGEFPPYADSRLLRVILLKVAKGTGQLACPTAGTPAFISTD